MLKNFLKVAGRQLLRNRYFVLLNVLGIGIAVACSIIAYLNLKYDLGYDQFQEKRDRIYRVTTYKKSNRQLYGFSPLPLADQVREGVPGLEKAVRYHYRTAVVKRADRVFSESVHFVDSAFLDVFTYGVAQGNPLALNDINQVILTPEMADKYFGQDNPIGQTLTLYAGKAYQKELTVGAVLEAYPRNTSMPFDVLTGIGNLIVQDEPADLTDWEKFVDVTFLLLEENAPTQPVIAALNRYAPIQNQHREDWGVEKFDLEPLTEVAHNNRAGIIRGNYLWPSFPESAVWGPILIALMLFISACLNFTNTSVALSDRRLKEMGIRKVMGGTQRQLVAQLLIENLFVCLLGLLAGIMIAELLMPVYNRMWPYLYLEADYTSNLPLLGFLGGLLFLTTLLGGAYPAFYLSSFNPVNIFRRQVRFGGSNWFTRIMLGVQVMISLMVIISGVAFAQNAAFQEKTDFGYDRKAISGIRIDGASDFQIMKAALNANPKIIDMAGTRMHIGHFLRRTEIASQGKEFETITMDVGKGYTSLMDLKIVQGQGFDLEKEMDRDVVLVNETLVREFNWPKAVGRQITMDSTLYSVVGIVEDFVQDDLFSPIAPVVIRMTEPDDYLYLIMRSKADDLIAVHEAVRSIWKERFPDRPFNGFYQDEVIAESLLVTNNIKWIFIFMAVVTILLAATGQFALVSLNILRRMKEIAIRRIVGASSLDIAYRVNNHFVWIFVLASLVGCFGGAFLAALLLDSIYATHVGIQYFLLMLAAGGILVISIITMGLRVYRVILVSPAEILKNE